MQTNPDTITTVIARDLDAKLRDDLRRACRHFITMCDESGVDSAEIVSHMLSTLAATLFEAMDKLAIPEEVYAEALNMWRQHKAEALASNKELN